MNFGPDLRPLIPDAEADTEVLTYCLNRATGSALEFGVASGRSLSLIAAYMPVIGFDSFEGLPEDWRPGFGKGRFATPQPEVPGAQIVAGWFCETLPGFDWPDDVGLIHVDCDLYSSTTEVLAHTRHLLKPGVFVVFDEYFGYPGSEKHEQKAWEEFVAVNNIAYSTIGHGREQVAFQIVETR